MERTEFETARKEFFERLGEYCYMVLATSENDHPMASTMTCLVFDGYIWMQTDSRFPKCRQIEANPQVALVKNATQIEGKAELCGHPLDEGNSRFAQLMNRYNPGSYEMYSKVPTEVVIRVTPETAVDWLYEAGDNRIFHYDFVGCDVKVEMYENAGK